MPSLSLHETRKVDKCNKKWGVLSHEYILAVYSASKQREAGDMVVARGL